MASDSTKAERFAQLLATCQRQVFVFAHSLLHNAADAEEVLQETNLVLWQKFDEYTPGTSFSAWACRIAQLEALRIRRRNSRGGQLLSDEFLQNLADDALGALENSEPRRSALNDCLKKLSERDRQLILHRYQPQASTRSLAEHLGRSVQGTRKALLRIRLALLRCIERSLAEEEC